MYPLYNRGYRIEFCWVPGHVNRGYRIEFCWVPGHVDMPGNERADGIAREAAIKAALPSPVPCTDVLPTIIKPS